MKSHFDTTRDLKWDEIAFAMSIEVDNAVADYIEERWSVDVREIRDHVLGQIYERLAEGDKESLAIAWLHARATQAVEDALREDPETAETEEVEDALNEL